MTMRISARAWMNVLQVACNVLCGVPELSVNWTSFFSFFLFSFIEMLHTVIPSVSFGLRSPSASVTFVGCTFSPPSGINVAALLVLRIAFQSILTSLSVGLCANLCQVALSPKDQRRVYGRSRGPRSTGGRSMGRGVNSAPLPSPPPPHLSNTHTHTL